MVGTDALPLLEAEAAERKRAKAREAGKARGGLNRPAPRKPLVDRKNADTHKPPRKQQKAAADAAAMVGKSNTGRLSRTAVTGVRDCARMDATTPPTGSIHVRAPRALLDRVERLARAGVPRAAVVRRLLALGLDRVASEPGAFFDLDAPGGLPR